MEGKMFGGMNGVIEKKEQGKEMNRREKEE